MRLTVIGCGHLGAIHAACMASIGHEVVGVDIDDHRVRMLNSGKAWFCEPGLDEMLAANIKAGRLKFTTSFARAGRFGQVHFIGVATPGREDGSYDLSQLHAAVSALLPHLAGESLIIGKSTVPPGTAAALQEMVNSGWRGDQLKVARVLWNPEFLREGCAIQDTLRPDRIVVGTASAEAAEIALEIYRPVVDSGVPFLVTDLATAELVKGAANAFLATKISFINAMADVCSGINGDVAALVRALGLDPRIAPAFLSPGIGYAGACLPKDIRGLGAFVRRIGARNAAVLLSAVDSINTSRSGQVLDLVREALGEVTGQRITVWGAAFKPGIDDVRGSAGLQIAHRLHELGARVTVYDPMASGNAAAVFPELAYANSALAAATDADLLLVVTAWPEFVEVSPAKAADVVARKAVVDACQGIRGAAWREAGWEVSSLAGTRA